MRRGRRSTVRAAIFSSLASILQYVRRGESPAARNAHEYWEADFAAERSSVAAGFKRVLDAQLGDFAKAASRQLELPEGCKG